MTRDEVDWANRDEVADYLIEVAAELAYLVREDDPAEAQRIIRAKVPSHEWLTLIHVMAMCIDDTRSVTEMLAWTMPAGDGEPYERRHAEYQHQRFLGETTDSMPHGVVIGERMWQKARSGRPVAAVKS